MVVVEVAIQVLAHRVAVALQEMEPQVAMEPTGSHLSMALKEEITAQTPNVSAAFHRAPTGRSVVRGAPRRSSHHIDSPGG